MIKLILKSKYNAVIDEFAIDTDHVPRVGELLNMGGHPAFKGFDTATFTVLEVLHVYRDGKLFPEVTCRQ
jgi:hypothetical protein